MPEELDAAGGMWWRFTSYELDQGRIVPGAEAELERYDPWEAYREVRQERSENELPYQSLVSLIERARLKVVLQKNSVQLTPESEQGLLDWCTRYGLLGVLLHRLSAATLAARWEPMRGEYVRDGVTREAIEPVLRRFFPVATGWQVTATAHLGRVIEPTDSIRAQDLVSDSDLASNWPSPHVIIRDVSTNRLEEEPLSKTWARFFPSVPEGETDTFDYPVPLSEGFWRMYAEPLDDFLDAARSLRNALRALGQMKPYKEASDEERREIVGGRDALHSLTRSVSPTIALLEDGSIRQEWIAPSLLASLGMMALQDLSEDRRIRSCAACGSIFLTSAYQAQYCSPRCRNRAQKQRYRERVRARRGESTPVGQTGAASKRKK